MKLNKAYNCAELSNILEANCEQDTNNIFDTFSSIAYPIHKSLGFITDDKINNDISSFSGLIVSIHFHKILIKKSLYSRQIM
jgi:hypothetical protein